jgi:hypothetical protein
VRSTLLWFFVRRENFKTLRLADDQRFNKNPQRCAW